MKKFLRRIVNVYSFSFTCKKGGHQVQYLLSLVSRFMVYHFSLGNKWARESFGKKSWLKYCYCHRAKSTLFAKDIESLISREGNIMGYCKINYQAIILPHEPHFAKKIVGVLLFLLALFNVSKRCFSGILFNLYGDLIRKVEFSDFTPHP